MVKEEFVFTDAEFEPETVTLTRAEIDALNKYNEKVKRELVREILKEVRELYMVDDRYAALERRLKKKYRGNSE